MQAAKVDDFQSYTAGTITSGVTGGVWRGIPSDTTYARISEEAGNLFLQTGLNNNGRGAYRSIGPITNTASSTTLFVRIYCTTSSQDTSFGLSDVVTTSAATFGDFEAQMVLANGDDSTHVNLRGRDGSAVETYLALNLNQWYNVWAVIDQTTDSFNMYVTTGYADAAGTAPINPDPVNFRNGTTADLAYFLVLTNYRDMNYRLDQIHLTNGVNLTNPVAGEPYEPSVVLEANGSVVDVTLKWKAGADGDTTSGNAVRPDIANQYIFMAAGSEPNLIYQGATGDPGTANPDSQFTLSRAYDTTYRWAVVEALSGYEQTFTVGTSTLSDVDPNNIIGFTWSFTSLTSVPEITSQPLETRVFLSDAIASLTCKFTSVSPATATWYKYVDGVNDQALTNGVKYSINTVSEGINYTSTLTVQTLADSDQGNYYCVVSNGMQVKSDTVAVVIKKLLAQYSFEQNLNDSVGASHGDAFDLSLADPNLGESSIVYLTGNDRVEGTYALKLDGIGQYVDFGTAASPKAGALLKGVGGGLDSGTIIGWVKPTKSSTLWSNYNTNYTTGFRLSLASNAGTADTRMHFRGEGLAGEQQEGGAAQGRPGRPGWNMFDGAWHLAAASWTAGRPLRVYVDGQQVASVDAVASDKYAAWQRGVLLGAVRSTPADRTILGDFFGGIVDNLRVYNYEIDALDIAQEYYAATAIQPCLNASFDGYLYNFDNTGSSYCKVDLADFAVFANNWLTSGLYSGL
jgi:hypothetical protein